MSSIHGHQVLEMMITSDQPYSTASLINAITQRFGPNARFHLFRPGFNRRRAG